MNTSAWNRPFDDLSSERIRLEADPVAAILSIAEARRVELAGSEYLDFEVDQNPDRERALRVAELVKLVSITARLSPNLAQRARALGERGLRGLDALHIASAETLEADLLVTTDDRMRKAARRAGADVVVRVVGPIEALAIIEREIGP